MTLSSVLRLRPAAAQPIRCSHEDLLLSPGLGASCNCIAGTCRQPTSMLIVSCSKVLSWMGMQGCHSLCLGLRRQLQDKHVQPAIEGQSKSSASQLQARRHLFQMVVIVDCPLIPLPGAWTQLQAATCSSTVRGCEYMMALSLAQGLRASSCRAGKCISHVHKGAQTLQHTATVQQIAGDSWRVLSIGPMERKLCKSACPSDRHQNVSQEGGRGMHPRPCSRLRRPPVLNIEMRRERLAEASLRSAASL